MKFIKIKIRNFLSIDKISLGLSDRGNVLILGRNLSGPSVSSNGAGKTSLWDALTWALYGKTLRSLPADSVISEAKDHCSVSVFLQDDRHIPWIVTRSRSKSSPSLILKRDGKDVTFSNIQETQNRINSLVGLDFETFVSSVFFGHDSLRFAGLSDKEKKGILESLLGLGAYEKAFEECKSKVAGQKALLQVTNASYSKGKERIADIRSRIKEIKENIGKEEKRIDKNISVHKDNLSKCNEEIESFKSKKDRYDRIISKKESIERRISSYQDTVSEFKQEYSEVVKEISKLDKQLCSVRDEKEPDCPTCGQQIKGKSKSKTIDHLKTVIDNKAKGLADLQNQCKVANRKAKKLERRKKRLVKNINFDKAQGLQNKIYELTERKQGIIAQIALAKKSKTYSHSALVEARKNLKKEKGQLVEVSKDVKKFEKRIGIYEYLSEAFGPHGIRSYLLDNVVDFLNDRANAYSETLTDGHIRIKFSTVTRLKNKSVVDRFSLEARNKNGAKIYAGNSGGERQRIDICVALALRDLARSRSRSKIDLAIFDEVFERLDETGCDKVIQLLNQEKEQFGSCFIVTHNEKLKPYFSNRIEIVKENGVSRIK